MGRSYLIVMVFLGIFGAVAGNLRAPGGTFESKSAKAEPFADVQAAAEEKSARKAPRDHGDSIVLDRHSDGHFYADVKLNGTTVNMLVDTGASGIALSVDDARRAGIATSIGMNRDIGEGAGGTVYGDVVRVGRVELGGVEQQDVPAVVLNGGDMSLLGQSFLKEFRSVQIEGDEMVLR